VLQVQREELVLYYKSRALSGYPGRTPLAGLAAGYEAMARHLPVGSPALLLALRQLAQHAQRLLQPPSSAATQHGLDLINLLAHLMLLVEFGVTIFLTYLFCFVEDCWHDKLGAVLC